MVVVTERALCATVMPDAPPLPVRAPLVPTLYILMLRIGSAIVREIAGKIVRVHLLSQIF